MDVQRRQYPGPCPPSLVDRGQIRLGGTFLIAGILGYILTRSPGSIVLLPPWLSLELAVPMVFIPLVGALPTLAHTAAFGLLTAGVLGGGRLSTLWSCLTWALINAVFEIGQLPAVAAWFASLSGVVVTENTLVQWLVAYWSHGTFDPLDLAAAVVGAGFACLVTGERKYRTFLKETLHG